MFNKRFFRILTSCALVLTLVMALASINAFAEEPSAGGSKRNNDPTADNYSAAEFSAWGCGVEETTEYSVDVEWGAMTFQYDRGSWNTETHMATSGAGWVVYDNGNGQPLGKVQNAINRITVTNHSNAAVSVSLKFTPATEFGVTGGTFAASQNAASEDFLATVNAAAGEIKLPSADNNEGEGEGVGKATVANVYFMPTNPLTPGITQWTRIGTITVTISTAATP